ncbi:hypothetical protein NN561_013681 [Cricetulus griseus]
MVTTPSSSAASLRIWLANTCASSRMETSASATAPRIQHATRQSSQRGGRGAPGQPGQRGQRRTRAVGLTVSSSLGSRAMPPAATPRRPAPGAGRGRRSPPNFPVSCAPGSAARRRWLANLGGARLQRGRAGGHHRPAAAAAPRPRRPKAGAAASTGGAPPPSLLRVPAQPEDGDGATSACAAARLARSPGEEGEGGLKDPSERRERKESGGGKGRCLVPPRCAPAPYTSRLRCCRGCGDLWKEEGGGESPALAPPLPRLHRATPRESRGPGR